MCGLSRAHWSIRSISSRIWPSRGMASGRPSRLSSSPGAKSSSMSPMGAMRGSSSALPPLRARKMRSSSRAARRVGSRMVQRARSKADGAAPVGKPASTASARMSRNGWPGPIVSTRGSRMLIAGHAPRACSARPIASGVPTCSHFPQWLRPYKRFLAIARSHSRFIENFPAGAPSKRRGATR